MHSFPIVSTLAAAECLLSMPNISKNMILEIERIRMQGGKIFRLFATKAPTLVASAGPARLTGPAASARQATSSMSPHL